MTPGGLELLGALEGHHAFIGPEEVVVDLTNRCNANCIACWSYSPLLRDPPTTAWKLQELSFESAARLIDDCAVIGTRRIRFTGGGDPLMHPRFHDLIRRIKDRGMRAEATTSLISGDARRLLASGIDALTVTLWAATPATYSRTHPNQSPRTFSRLERMLKELALAPRPPEITVANALSSVNFDEAERMYEWAAGLGLHAVQFSLADTIPGSTDRLALGPPERQRALEAVRRIRGRATELGERAPRLVELEELEDRLAGPGARPGGYERERIDSLPCTVGWTFSRILASGDVVGCRRAAKLPLGNVNRTSLRELWYGLKYGEFRHKALAVRKDDPYFAAVRCYEACENYRQNRSVQDRLVGLGQEGRAALQGRIAAYQDAGRRLGERGVSSGALTPAAARDSSSELAPAPASPFPPFAPSSGGAASRGVAPSSGETASRGVAPSASRGNGAADSPSSGNGNGHAKLEGLPSPVPHGGNGSTAPLHSEDSLPEIERA